MVGIKDGKAQIYFSQGRRKCFNIALSNPRFDQFYQNHKQHFRISHVYMHLTGHSCFSNMLIPKASSGRLKHFHQKFSFISKFLSYISLIEPIGSLQSQYPSASSMEKGKRNKYNYSIVFKCIVLSVSN